MRCRLIFVEHNGNKNKFYNMEVVGDKLNVEFGRVGSTPQTATYPSSMFNNKKREKLHSVFTTTNNSQISIMVLKHPDINLANQLLADWWLNNNKVTSLEFKQELRNEYPEYNWTQQWTSWYLSQTDHPFEDNGTFKTYYRDNNTLFGTITLSSSFPLSQASQQVVSVELTLDVINKLAEDYHGVRLTKERIKKYLKERSVEDFDDFEELFHDSNWAFTGKYTADNKKVYVAINPDEYFSQSRQIITPIANLSKPHIKNTLKKRYGNVTIEYLLDNQGEECFRLFKQYCK